MTHMRYPISDTARRASDTSARRILAAASLGHAINDLLQALLPAIYPVLAASFGLSFAQVGTIALVNQATASVLQPFVGTVTDRFPMPWLLPAGMAMTMAGLLLLGQAPSYLMVLPAVALVGIGSAIFHPESSRLARAASGGRPGLAQSVFQLGGNLGASLGPLMAALVISPLGQHAVGYFAPLALLGMLVLGSASFAAPSRLPARQGAAAAAPVKPRALGFLALLLLLMFSKYFYMASFSNYYTFFLMRRFGLPVHQAQYCLFVYLASISAGTLLGGAIGDRIGRRRVILVSILGVLPFSLALPYMPLALTIALSIPIGFLLASAFPAIVVYAQELLPGRTGMVSGLMFGLAFGMGGIAAALLGHAADHAGIAAVYRACAFIPAIGGLALLLPELGQAGQARPGGARPPGM